MTIWTATVLDDEQRERFSDLLRYLAYAGVGLAATLGLLGLGALSRAGRYTWPFFFLGQFICLGVLGASYVYANFWLAMAGLFGAIVVLAGASGG
ncbi:hypothetical protein ACIA5H_02850 [Nocardia sp. NPDC051900]|uniref:hypothetical protein n=1 Tax=Nocardia sp. NPDC051900 TaxID=3364326 RepID=UPI0037A2953F